MRGPSADRVIYFHYSVESTNADISVQNSDTNWLDKLSFVRTLLIAKLSPSVLVN